MRIVPPLPKEPRYRPVPIERALLLCAPRDGLSCRVQLARLGSRVRPVAPLSRGEGKGATCALHLRSEGA